MPYIMYDPTEDSRTRDKVHVRCEGRVFVFEPYKPVQLSDQQWRYMSQRGADDIGLGIFDTNDSLVAELLESRAKSIEVKKAPAKKADPPEEKPKEEKAEGSLYEQALAMDSWQKLRKFAKDHLNPSPRTRDGILEAFKELSDA